MYGQGFDIHPSQLAAVRRPAYTGEEIEFKFRIEGDRARTIGYGVSLNVTRRVHVTIEAVEAAKVSLQLESPREFHTACISTGQGSSEAGQDLQGMH